MTTKRRYLSTLNAHSICALNPWVAPWVSLAYACKVANSPLFLSIGTMLVSWRERNCASSGLMKFPSSSFGAESEMTLEAIPCRPSAQLCSLRCVGDIHTMSPSASTRSSSYRILSRCSQHCHHRRQTFFKTSNVVIGGGRLRPNAWGIMLENAHQRFAREGMTKADE